MNSGAAPQKKLSNGQLGTFIALASLGMLFGTLLLSFILIRLKHKTWPPVGVEPFEPLLPSLSTGVVLASSLVLHLAYRKLERNEIQAFRNFWGFATISGLVFLILQVAWLTQMFSMGIQVNSNILASMIYLFVFAHGVHLFSAWVWLCWIWKKRDRFGGKNHEVPRLASWAWHFLTAVWILLFGALQ